MTKEEFRELDKEAQREERKKMWLIIKATVEKVEEADIALKILKPSLYGVGGKGHMGTNKLLLFADMFQEIGNVVPELDLFNAIKIGRSEAATLIRKLLKIGEADQRTWISFDPELGLYTLVGLGPHAPKNWTGYSPPEIDEDMECMI